VKLRRHGTQEEIAEATGRLLQVLWCNRPLAAQLQLAPAEASGRWSE
jgi:hypothetical protein